MLQKAGGRGGFVNHEGYWKIDVIPKCEDLIGHSLKG